MAINQVTHNNRIIPSWIPFIQLAIDELNSTMPNVTPAITILEEIQPLINFLEERADKEGMIHVT
tara:strand:+ start:288 stop:482 length:195 start_codon:yes stop_codon:yes gene_type:complete